MASILRLLDTDSMPSEVRWLGRPETRRGEVVSLNLPENLSRNMNPQFAAVVESLHPSFQRLVEMNPVLYAALPKQMPTAGIYLFSEGTRHLYVGRSRDIRGRLGRHCRPGATYRMAAFAFRLAREATGRLKATYKKEGSRSALMEDLTFREAFEAAKVRIREMDLRFVEEIDPLRQTVLEVYVAVALETPYNDFETH